MLDHVVVTTKSFVNPDKLIDDCRVVIHDGFNSTWDHVRSLLNPDRLMDDCDVVIQDGLVSTSAHVKSLLNPDRLMPIASMIPTPADSEYQTIPSL